MGELYPTYGEQYSTLARIYWADKERGEAETYALMSIGVLEEHWYIRCT
jgi:hypothetical protein